MWNIVEEVRPGCRNVAAKVLNNGKFEIFLGWVLKVHSGVWVEKYGVVKNFFYRYECREVVIGLNTNLACVSKLGEGGLVVYDYPSTCQREHHFVPDRDFFATLLLI